MRERGGDKRRSGGVNEVMRDKLLCVESAFCS